jgi:tRNA-Thr(GGU) m(6)t(6)A37 methyltransferase TsaA
MPSLKTVLVDMEICYKQIGTIRSDFKTLKQHDEFEHGEGKALIELFPEYEEGLLDIEKHFSHCFVIYHLHLSKDVGLTMHPFMDPKYPKIGVFASGGPFRPNPIAITPCRIVHVEGNRLHVEGLDAMDGSPVIDIKPYSPQHYGVVNPRVAKWEEEHHGTGPKDP